MDPSHMNTGHPEMAQKEISNAIINLEGNLEFREAFSQNSHTRLGESKLLCPAYILCLVISLMVPKWIPLSQACKIHLPRQQFREFLLIVSS